MTNPAAIKLARDLRLRAAVIAIERQALAAASDLFDTPQQYQTDCSTPKPRGHGGGNGAAV